MPNFFDMRSSTICLAEEERALPLHFLANPIQCIAALAGLAQSHHKWSAVRRYLFTLPSLLMLAVLFGQEVFPQQIATPLSSSKSPKVEEPLAGDPLGRDTPRGTMFGFVRHARREDYATAAQYLQTNSGRAETEAQELQELMDLRFKGSLDFISDKPEGNVDDGLGLDRDRVGIVDVAGQQVEIILVRVEDIASKRRVWLISRETLLGAQSLYTEMQPSPIVRHLPEALTTNYFLSVSAAQWIGWLLSLPAAYYLSWAVVFVLRVLYKVPRKWRAEPSRFASFRSPFRFSCFVVLHAYLVYLLKIPLLYRWYYIRIIFGLLLGAIFWIASRAVEVFFERRVRQLGSWAVERQSMLVLGSRMIRVGLFVLAVLAIATALGFDTKAMLAGVGIGGLAIAFAAQKTLENVIGGVSLLLDRAVHVGDTCRIGDRLGTVEDIGLRSLRLRMLDQTLVVVPNGLLAQVQFENLASRTKLLIQNTFSVRIETPLEKLQAMLHSVQQMLDQLSYVEQGTSRVRIVRFAGAATEIELFAYVLTSDSEAFTALRQNVMIKVLEIVEGEGVRLAGTTQLSYIELGSQFTPDSAREAHPDSLRPRGATEAVIQSRRAGVGTK